MSNLLGTGNSVPSVYFLALRAHQWLKNTVAAALTIVAKLPELLQRARQPDDQAG